MSLYKNYVDKYSEETIEFSKQWFKKFAKSYPSFQFVINYSEIKGAKFKKNKKKANTDADQSFYKGKRKIQKICRGV